MLRGGKLRPKRGNLHTIRCYLIFLGIGGYKSVQVLGVDKRATHEEIKKAYRAKAREFHPDKHANATKEEQVSVALHKININSKAVSRTSWKLK